MLEIKVKYFNGINGIKKLEVGDWIDLKAAEEVEIKAFEHVLIPLGVAMELPPRHEALIVPRSSTFKKYGIIQTNSPGVVDESYCGPDDQWFMSVVALRDTVIPKNERICQFRVQKKMENVRLIIVDDLDGINRGGHGSTGYK